MNSDATERFRTVNQQIQEHTATLRSFVEDQDFGIAFNDYAEISENGNSLLDLKIQLLLQYLSGLTGIGLAKLRKPNSLAPHSDMILQTAKVRAALEKVRPLENKLRYQLEKVLKVDADASYSDPLSFKPNLSGLAGSVEQGTVDADVEDVEEESSESDEETEKAGKYVPPKLTAMPYFDETRTARQEREERSKRRMISRGIVQDMMEELVDEPVEVRHTGNELGDRVRRKFLDKQREKERFEEENMIRLNRTKKDKALERRAEKLCGAGEFSAMSDFRDFDSLMNRQDSGKKRKAKGGKGKKRKRVRI